jgi:hypothetical protein
MGGPAWSGVAVIEFRDSGLGDLAIRLEKASRSLDAEIATAVRVEMEKLPAAVQKSIHDKLPKRVGMADRFAKNIETRLNRRPGMASLSLVAPGRRERDLLTVDRGVVRHPVYGNRKAWVGQVVTPYFWSAPVKETTAAVEAAVKAALDRVGRHVK